MDKRCTRRWTKHRWEQTTGKHKINSWMEWSSPINGPGAKLFI